MILRVRVTRPIVGWRGCVLCSQGCMEKVQGWLQENLGVILGVCVGVAVIEVWVPSPLPPPRAALHQIQPALQMFGVEGGVS